MTGHVMQFIGVSTQHSSIHPVFRAWQPLLGLPDNAELVGVDLPLDAPPERYRAAVRAMADDDAVAGALVTTHKLNVFEAARDLFTHVAPDAAALQEVSCLVTSDGAVQAHALDRITSGLALEAITSDIAGRDVVIMGAGGAGKALMVHLVNRPKPPARVVLTDTSGDRLDAAIEAAAGTPHGVTVSTRLLDGPNDEVVADARDGALIVNATGMGKDRPGSPVSDDVLLPREAIVWDFNYRGSLDLLAQARAMPDDRQVRIEDGWTYFLHGWTRAIATVFDLDIPTSGPTFDRLGQAARRAQAAA